MSSPASQHSSPAAKMSLSEQALQAQTEAEESFPATKPSSPATKMSRSERAKASIDKALQAQTEAEETLLVLRRVPCVLQAVHSIISKETVEPDDLKKATQFLATVQSAMENSADTVKKLLKVSEKTPTSGLSARASYAANRLRSVDPKLNVNLRRKSDALIALEAVALEVEDRPQPKKRKRVLVEGIPDPADGQRYTKREAINILKPLSKKERPGLIDHWIAERKIPLLTRRSMNKIMKNVADGTYITPQWGQAGPPAIMTVEELMEANRKIQGQKGNLIEEGDIERALYDHAVEERFTRQGLPVPPDFKMSRTTVRRYTELCATVDPNVYIQKTEESKAMDEVIARF